MQQGGRETCCFCSGVCLLRFGRALKLTKGKAFRQMAANEFWHHEERITSRSSVLRQSAQRKAAFCNVIRNTWVWQPGTHEACFCLLRPHQLRRNNSLTFPFFMTCLLHLSHHQMCLCNVYNGQIYIYILFISWDFVRFFLNIMAIKCFILILSVSLKMSIPLWLAWQLLKLKHTRLIRRKRSKTIKGALLFALPVYLVNAELMLGLSNSRKMK